MIIYLFKFSAVLAILLGFYKFLLEPQLNHRFKRFYLLGSLFLALSIPLNTFKTYVDRPVQVTSEVQPELVQIDGMVPCEEAKAPPLISATDILWGLYILGVAVFGVRFIMNLYRLNRKIHHGQKVRNGALINVLVEERISPYTFFRFIFYNRDELLNDKIPEEVKWHEEAHAGQLHSIDTIILELIQVVFWFNPLIYFTKNAVRLNHEFLADQAVLRKGVSPNRYQETVLAFATLGQQEALTIPFNYSFIKKRFKIMKTQTTKRSSYFRNLLVLPLVSLMLFGFSNRETILKPSDSIAEVGVMDQTNFSDQDVVEEYNKLAKHYGTYPSYDFVKKAKDMYRMWTLHEKMTDEERASAEPYFRSTTSLDVTITNDGRYFTGDGKETSLASIENLFKQLTAEELSEAYAFSREFDVGKYIRQNRERKMSKFSLNHIYVSIRSEEFFEGKKINKLTPKSRKIHETMEKSGLKLVTPAALNPKLSGYLEELYSLLRKYAVQVDY